MRYFFITFLVLLCSPAFANQTLAYKCIMHRHLILLNDVLTEGNLSVFEFNADARDLRFDSPHYFADATFSIQHISQNRIEAIDEGKTFIYNKGRFHFSFISHSHVTMMSGDCQPIAYVNES